MYFFFSWVGYGATINTNKRDLTLILQNFYRCFRPSSSFSFYFIFDWKEVGGVFINLVDLYGGSSGPKLCLLPVYRVEHLCFLTARTALQAVLGLWGLCLRWHLSASCVWVVSFPCSFFVVLVTSSSQRARSKGGVTHFLFFSWLAWSRYEGE